MSEESASREQTEMRRVECPECCHVFGIPVPQPMGPNNISKNEIWVYLWNEGGESQTKIAERLGISQPTVSRLYRAAKKKIE